MNPREQLYTPNTASYHDTPVLNGEIGEVYQEEELPTSFVVESNLGLDHLVGDANDIQTPVKEKWKPITKKIDDLV
jgi:hypothetical protein